MRRTRALVLALAVLALGGWEPLWRTDPDVDAGNRAYREGRLDDAQAAYARARANGVGGAALSYDEGTATMAQAEAAPEADRGPIFDRALDQLADATTARDPSLRGRAHYNRGNIRMQQGKFDEAIGEYKDALRADPTLESARSNLELALRRREKQRQQQQGKGQGQPQQGQGQGQQQQPQQGQGQGQGQQQQPQQPQQGQGQGQGQQQQPQQPQQGQGQGQDQQQQQQPQQGQGQPQQPDQPQDPQQGQGQGQPPPQPPQGQGQPPQQPPQGQGQQGQPDQQPPRQMPRMRWPDDESGQTPRTSPQQKLGDLEGMSRQLRRSKVRDGQGGFGSTTTQDW